MDSDRPDLEQLESVKSGGDPGILSITLVCLLGLALFGFVLWLIALLVGFGEFHVRLGVNGDTMMGAVFAAVAFALIVILRTPLCDHYWETSSEGLWYQGTLRRGLIPWTKVTRAETKWVNVVLGRRHLIRAGGRTAAAPSGDPALTASIWQHLRRVGKSEGIETSEQAESIWHAIPSDVPEELEWTNPNPPDVGMVTIKLALELGVGLAILLLTSHKVFAWFVAIFVGVFMGQTGSRLGVARRIRLRPDQLEAATAWRTVSADWDAISSAEWSRSGGELNIQFAWHTTVRIPWRRGDVDSTAMVAAIIHRLRTRSNPIVLSMPGEPEG